MCWFYTEWQFLILTPFALCVLASQTPTGLLRDCERRSAASWMAARMVAVCGFRRVTPATASTDTPWTCPAWPASVRVHQRSTATKNQEEEEEEERLGFNVRSLSLRPQMWMNAQNWTTGCCYARMQSASTQSGPISACASPASPPLTNPTTAWRRRQSARRPGRSEHGRTLRERQEAPRADSYDYTRWRCPPSAFGLCPSSALADWVSWLGSSVQGRPQISKPLQANKQPGEKFAGCV